MLMTAQPPPATPVVPSIPRPAGVSARGELQPVAHARVGSMAGGVISSITVTVGQSVGQEQEIARVHTATQTEVLTAPFAGTVTGLPAHVGDTVAPGHVIATVGDLSRLRVETTDVDEFMVADIVPGQEVTVIIDALDLQWSRGFVLTVALQPQLNNRGDDHYPVVVELAGGTSDLRAGMSVRVYFPDSTPE